jgi:hypothetical protein
VGAEEKNMEGVNLTKIHCKHICKYHNYSLVKQLYFLLKLKNNEIKERTKTT